MDLQGLCFHLRKRRGLYLLEERFPTAVAFVEGFSSALDGEPLDGFQDYVANRLLGRSSSIHWPYIIASQVKPEILDGAVGLDVVPHDAESGLIEVMIDLIEAFQSSQAKGD